MPPKKKLDSLPQPQHRTPKQGEGAMERYLGERGGGTLGVSKVEQARESMGRPQRPGEKETQEQIYPRATSNRERGGSPCQSSQGLDKETFEEERDWKAQIWSLPTKADLDVFLVKMEQTFKKEIDNLKQETSHLGHRLEILETQQEELSSTMLQLRDRCLTQEKQIATLTNQIDDMENRNRRSNIRIRGLPETIGPQEITYTLQSVFKEILGGEDQVKIEIDRAHRTLGPPSIDSIRTRDVVCRLHKYAEKEAIMKHMRDRQYFEFNGIQLQFFPDLSGRTLAQRRALRPLLGELQKAKIPYRWGYPFSLMVHHEGRTHILRDPSELSQFTDSLKLPKVALPDWRTIEAISIPRRSPSWQKVPMKGN